MMDSLEYELYEAEVNAQWEKLGAAQTNEEIQEVLNTWPELKDFEIKEQNEDSFNCDSEE